MSDIAHGCEDSMDTFTSNDPTCI